MADWCPPGWHDLYGAGYHVPHERVMRDGVDVTDSPELWGDLYLRPWRIRRSRSRYESDVLWLERRAEVLAERQLRLDA